MNLGSLLDEREAAKVLGLPVSTLKFWRLCANRGPRFERILGRVRYKPAELKRFQAARAARKAGSK